MTRFRSTRDLTSRTMKERAIQKVDNAVHVLLLRCLELAVAHHHRRGCCMGHISIHIHVKVDLSYKQILSVRHHRNQHISCTCEIRCTICPVSTLTCIHHCIEASDGGVTVRKLMNKSCLLQRRCFPDLA